MKLLSPLRLIICCVATASATASPLMDVESIVVDAILDIRYHSSYNFVGEPIAGYEQAKCLLTPEAALALEAVQQTAASQGLTLKIFDCYRPQRAVDHFVRWARNPGDTRMQRTFYPAVPKDELFSRGYIAEKSGHSRGSTVDLTLVSLDPDSGEVGELDMGTRYDFFDPLSHTDNPEVTGEVRHNRQLLKKLMSDQGFRNLPEEWWHYTLEDEPYPDTYFDIPVQ